jgi:hypothetical protein
MFDRVVDEVRKQLARAGNTDVALDVGPYRESIRLSLGATEIFSVTRANLNTMGPTPREVAEAYRRRYRDVIAART